MLEYELPNREILRISDEVLNIFHTSRQRSCWQSESGGILLGRVFEDFLLIDRVTTPDDARDKRGLFFFHRHKGRAQSIINEAFVESHGEQIYIGEWHTHAQKRPQPSWKDNLEIKRAFNKSQLSLDYLICIVVGNQNVVGNIWVGCHDSNGMRSCERHQASF